MEERETDIRTIVRNSWSIEEEQIIRPCAEDLAHIKKLKDLGPCDGSMPYPHTIITTIRPYKNSHANSAIGSIEVCKSRSEDTGTLKKFEIKVSFNDAKLCCGFIKSFKGEQKGKEVLFNVGARSRLYDVMHALNIISHFSDRMKNDIATFCTSFDQRNEENILRVRAELFGEKASISLFSRAKLAVFVYRESYNQEELSACFKTLRLQS